MRSPTFRVFFLPVKVQCGSHVVGRFLPVANRQLSRKHKKGDRLYADRFRSVCGNTNKFNEIQKWKEEEKTTYYIHEVIDSFLT